VLRRNKCVDILYHIAEKSQPRQGASQIDLEHKR